MVDVVAMMNDCWTPFAKRAAERGVHVERDSPAIIIETDLDKLKMIVNNLIDNAVSYVDDRGTIRIWAQRAGDDLLLCVTNTGSQITPSQVPHLTERFCAEMTRAATPDCTAAWDFRSAIGWQFSSVVGFASNRKMESFRQT